MLSGRRLLPFVIALVGMIVLALLPVAAGSKMQATSRASVHISSTSAAPSSVSTLDVVSISTTLASDGATAKGLGVVMVIRDGAGQTILREQQAGISLAERNSLSIYWVWRVPGGLAAGPYTIEMDVVNEDGNVLAVDKGATFNVVL